MESVSVSVLVSVSEVSVSEVSVSEVSVLSDDAPVSYTDGSSGFGLVEQAINNKSVEIRIFIPSILYSQSIQC